MKPREAPALLECSECEDGSVLTFLRSDTGADSPPEAWIECEECQGDGKREACSCTTSEPGWRDAQDVYDICGDCCRPITPPAPHEGP